MNIKQIAKIIKENGGNLYLVGGAIRDNAMKREVIDEDYCVTGMDSNDFINLFPEAKIRGKSFEVFDIEKKEFAMARKEVKKGKGHKEFEITTGTDITIEEDLKRRDITINSIAQDVLTGEVIDPYHGMKDIENKLIRATTQSFKEDPLRVYRVARFAANLEFEVANDTIKMMYELKSELSTLSKERVFVEFRKALSSKTPSIFFEVLKRANVLDVHFKEVYDLIGSEQPKKYHPEGDSYNHTMQVLDFTAKNTQELQLRYSALVHDLGKGITPKEKYPHHYGHDISGVVLVKKLSNRIGVPNAWRKCGEVASKEHMIGGRFGEMTPQKKVAFIERVDKTILGLEGLQLIVLADRKGRGDYVETEMEARKSRFSEIGQRCLEIINGQYIIDKYKIEKNAEEYKRFGELLHSERVNWIKENDISYMKSKKEV